jgi:hypothetical protein
MVLMEKIETQKEYLERRKAFVEERLKAQVIPPKVKDPEAPNMFERRPTEERELF